MVDAKSTRNNRAGAFVLAVLTDRDLKTTGLEWS